MNISWGNSWANSWGKSWGYIAKDQARSGWFRLWLIGLQEEANKKPEPEPLPTPVYTKVVEKLDGSAVVGEPVKRKKRAKIKVKEPEIVQPVFTPLPAFEPVGVTFFEEVREFVTNLNFPRINISFAALENKVKLREKKRRESDDIQALLLLV